MGDMLSPSTVKFSVILKNVENYSVAISNGGGIRTPETLLAGFSQWGVEETLRQIGGNVCFRAVGPT